MASDHLLLASLPEKMDIIISLPEKMAIVTSRIPLLLKASARTPRFEVRLQLAGKVPVKGRIRLEEIGNE